MTRCTVCTKPVLARDGQITLAARGRRFTLHYGCFALLGEEAWRVDGCVRCEHEGWDHEGDHVMEGTE